MAFPREIRAVVFDMDGLLVDTETGFRDVFFAVAAERGHEVPMPVFQQLIGVPNASALAALKAHFGPDFDAQGMFDACWLRFHDSLDVSTILKAGVAELLDHLDEMRIPRAIATSSPREAVTRYLGPRGMEERFDAIVTKGDYPRPKPNPDPFLTAAARLGIDPTDCLALEDSHNGVRAAHAAGMMTVMVPDLLDPTEEMHEKCLHVAETLHHVLDLMRLGVTGRPAEIG
ncbi:HAD family phosphatase [Thalassobaculum sp. OXR-137]|uniref:HAD family hydrolase n=1 Tax=Thalassobaculum sp. OXR-137 TaxID=3100173 RepID=UPI002AC8FD5F|nr:HAD family phosphatase [Thalassobaculum sp. OXR-137]WPZ32793.1 HAD family phosphatase [Thalassobaculum sp. OXR-137]